MCGRNTSLNIPVSGAGNDDSFLHLAVESPFAFLRFTKLLIPLDLKDLVRYHFFMHYYKV